MAKAKGIILLVVSGLLLTAAVVLVLTNLGNTSNVHFFWKTVEPSPSTAWLLVVTAAVGAGLLAIWRRAIPAGLRSLRDAKRKGIVKATEQRIKALEKTPE